VTLTFDLLTPGVDHFMPLLATCASLHQNQLIYFYCVDKFNNGRTNDEWTERKHHATCQSSRRTTQQEAVSHGYKIIELSIVNH